jgi:hypothetical protein
VTHNTVDTPASNVSPQTDDVFLVTATYSPAAGCVDTPYYATVTVSNTESAFSVSCSGCTTAPFAGVSLCDPNVCANGNEYTIVLDMQNPHPVTGTSITNVNYSSTSIDDGVIVSGSCSTGSSVQPTSQSWSANDTTFPCSLDCTNDTSITITYD